MAQQKPHQYKAWLYEPVESGACGAQIYIFPRDKRLTDEEYAQARADLDAALFQEKNLAWLIQICPWTGSNTILFHRFISGERSEIRALIVKMNK